MISRVTSSRGVVNGRRMKIDVTDGRRAYVHAAARRKVYVILPPEEAELGKCGRLKHAMYGTRDAAYNWECGYVNFMKSLVFLQGIASQCVFYHVERDLRSRGAW